MSQKFVSKGDGYGPGFYKIRESVIELRSIFPNLTNMEYAAWYSQRYGITQQRVHSILEAEANK